MPSQQTYSQLDDIHLEIHTALSLTLLPPAKHCFLQTSEKLSPSIHHLIRFLNFHRAVHLQNQVPDMAHPHLISHWMLQTLANQHSLTQLAPSLTLKGKDPNSLRGGAFTNHYGQTCYWSRMNYFSEYYHQLHFPHTSLVLGIL